VKAIRLSLGLLAVSVFAVEAPLSGLLKGVEDRYNRAKSLQVSFTEEYTPAGRSRRTESGKLLLRKPLRMRWDYTQPKGKLFVCDGKYLWLYNPIENRVEQMPLKESDDMRVPLAFLLGKLNFEKEFRNIQWHPEGADDVRITAEPKSDNLPYSSVDFVIGRDSHIKTVKVTYFDKSVLSYSFELEKMNPPVDAKDFEFSPPQGAELVKSGQ
jgi:outer membrane lipoprotein carrier protein